MVADEHTHQARQDGNDDDEDDVQPSAMARSRAILAMRPVRIFLVHEKSLPIGRVRPLRGMHLVVERRGGARRIHDRKAGPYKEDGRNHLLLAWTGKPEEKRAAPMFIVVFLWAGQMVPFASARSDANNILPPKLNPPLEGKAK